ncbi:class II fructose-bisphosphatase [Amycolatopsis ultiminotia]|uniref:Fructose-1,6-bisphosphatase n=1 Tax=Amycolatopsis ultiminotia TaxID=543629 RepID=A0ABP6YPU5_9PSEU
MTTQEWAARGVSGAPRAEGRNADAMAGAGHSDHALALELVRVTEAAAIAAGRWVGHGDEDSGKLAAVDAMHEHLNSVSVRGVVVLGAGGKRLPRGADAGNGAGPACDIGISAGDGALSIARDVPNALTAIVVAERGALYAPPVRYLEKLAVGPDYVDVVDLNRPVADNLRAVAKAKGVDVSDVAVAVLNRPRHLDLVRKIRDAGARVHLIEGGDIAGAVAVARPESPADLLLGVGGAAQGVLAAAALSCLGGSLQARLRPDDSGQGDPGHDFEAVLHNEDLVGGGNVLFCATGVTGSELLRGVAHHAGRTTTQSIVVSSPETVRIVTSEHRCEIEESREEYRSA